MLMSDFAYNWQLGFQNSASPTMSGIIDLFDSIMFYLVIIFIGVTYIMGYIIIEFKKKELSHKYINHGSVLEVIWTCIPALVLVSIAFPSFKLLYLMDEVIDPTITIKAIGHQWYWSYEINSYTETGESYTKEYDSYMVPTDELNKGDLRLLEVDNTVKIPVGIPIRVIVTSADVIHSWALPSLGIKADANPGRLNQVSLIANRLGSFYGQCSELCGVQHYGMPIVVESVLEEEYKDWIKE